MNPKYKPEHSIQIAIMGKLELGNNKMSILWHAEKLDSNYAYDGLTVVDKALSEEAINEEIRREAIMNGLK